MQSESDLIKNFNIPSSLFPVDAHDGAWVRLIGML